MPSGPGVIPEALIREIARDVPPGVTSVLLTSLTDPEEIIEQHGRAGTGALQLCASLTDHARRRLRKALPGIGLIQAVHVCGEESVGEAEDVSVSADALLLDSGSRGGSERLLGGTGRVHDWSISARIVEAVRVPVYLAGGLSPDNVAAAIRSVKPFGVDVCTGVREDDRLAVARLRAFLARARAG
jgi:phosphoribosylanthranilate isomerase